MLSDQNEVIKKTLNHRSVRKFDPNFTIPREHLELIIKAGQQASTSCSGQFCTIIEITQKIRDKFTPLCGNQQFVSDASYFCVICVDLHRLHQLVKLSGGEKQQWPLAGRTIGIFDAGLMSQNMVLVAESLGYDICFCGSCGDQPEKMIEILNLPDLVMPLTGLAIGKGLENPPTRPRLPSNLIHHKNQYKKYSEEELNEGIDLMTKALEEEGYYHKYSKQEKYTWKDHLKSKFGGSWLNQVENRRINALKIQKFL